MISSGKQTLVGRRVKTRLKVPAGEAITNSSDKSISLCMQKVLAVQNGICAETAENSQKEMPLSCDY